VSPIGGLRVVVLDDAPYLSWDGRIHAANATFHQFAAALLDVRDAAGHAEIATLVLAAPVREAMSPPATLAVDSRIQVVATAPFDGIAGYVRRAPLLAARNAPRLRSTICSADVVLLRLPASNALLAALIAVARGVPRVGYVVGSVREVVAGQRRRGPGAVGARVLAAGYDAATRLATAGASTIVVGADPSRGGILSSLVAPDEIHDRRADRWPADAGAVRLVYAGRLAGGKGLDTLLEALALLAGPGRAPVAVSLELVGTGPATAALTDQVAALGIVKRVHFAGHLARREEYLAALTAADVFVSASPAEGFPKAVLDAMAVGLPVVAAPAGRLAELTDLQATPGGAPILPVPAGDPAALAAALRALMDDPARGRRLRAAGHAFVLEHTMPVEAARLVARLRRAAEGVSRR